MSFFYRAWVVCWLLIVLAAPVWSAAPRGAAIDSPDPPLVRVNKALLDRIKTTRVNTVPIRRRLRVPGTVELDQTRVSRVGTAVNGRIIQVSALVGDDVKTGQSLATLTSPELSSLQLSLLQSLSNVELKRRAVARARKLFEAEVIARAELERRESELFLANVALKSYKDQLMLMGMLASAVEQVIKRREIHSEVAIYSKGSGTVIARNVSSGQVVKPADALFTVADLSSVWIEGDVPEQQVGFISVGDSVQVRIPALHGKNIRGNVIYIGATVDAATRSVAVRTHVNTPERTIKPKMLATLVITGPSEDRLVIPARAVVRDRDRDFVFVRRDTDAFRLTPVELEPTQDEMRPVVSGLSPSDEIVVNGALYLNNARKQQAQK